MNAMYSRARTFFLLTGVILTLSILSGCQVLLTPVTNQISADLTRVILNNRDIELVEDGIPAYLILLDAMILRSSNNAKLLFAGAELNSAYATAFVKDSERKRLMTAKAWDLAQQAACLRTKKLCDIDSMSFTELESVVAGLGKKEVPTLYGVMSAWASWINAHQADYRALAQLPSLHTLLDRLLELDESYQFGAPHMYKGVLDSLVPPLLGGNLERARQHFEKALDLSEGKNLFAKVYMAKQYARLIFDRELHDRLLTEVLAANPEVEDFTFQNILAQQLAAELLNSADDYF